ncbi:Uncharacterized SPBc2 prophage-derived protein YoqJ [Paenibacillus sp. UNC496MF]|uniref:DUF1273 domain-containing protein n=1 Tax=Paenibacillus sp. UNC496MF TaxID=1502753 RepID=UPI0008E4FE08|nr:DUF1273 domain-containing protein [Paenibacillus sp. UNC496MF]SFJ51734.1 Uncharacterized SPBc2 prophage-derived protein YoqJ [Paenibacillus sp. UNC496MF]
MKQVLVTGYKASELGIFSDKHPGVGVIKKALKQRLRALAEEGLEWVIVSGQWGVELWAAEVALELRAEYESLRLAVITPFLEQDENWSEPKKAAYASILGQADYVNSVSKQKYAGPWQFKARDRFLLDNTEGLLLIYDEEQEGSPRFLLELARKHAEVTPDYGIIVLNGEDLQNAAEEDRFYDYE